jgi:hypothetical protein
MTTSTRPCLILALVIALFVTGFVVLLANERPNGPIHHAVSRSFLGYQDSFITVPALAPPGPTSLYTNKPLPAPVSEYTFRAPAGMQPQPRNVKPLPPPEAPAAPPPKSPTPAGRLVSVGAYLGHEAGRRYESESVEAVQS